MDCQFATGQGEDVAHERLDTGEPLGLLRRLKPSEKIRVY
jgi:hypothetical protein